MKKYHSAIAATAITIISLMSFILIFARLLAKEILVDALDISNETISFIADYTWGDQLSRHPQKKEAKGFSEDYSEIRKIYDETILVNQTEGDEIPNSVDTSEDKSFLEKYKSDISELKSNINKYCNNHFIIRPYLTDIKLACSRMVGWNMAFARNDGDEYMLHNGVVDKAVTKNNTTCVPDISIKEAADKYGVQYIYLQYPYRVKSLDSNIPFGVENWSNENADKYLESMRLSGARILDLRKELENSGWDAHEGYYLTDKHWTTYSGFLSAKVISKYFADNLEGFTYHPEYHDESSYVIESVELNNPMIRENVDLLLPGFDVEFRYICLEENRDDDLELVGGFTDSVFDMTKAETGRFSNVLTAYSVSRVGASFLTETKNEMNYDHPGTVLFISNSFSWYIIPYLALDCDKVIFLHIDAKECAPDIIERVRPDVVIEAPF